MFPAHEAALKFALIHGTLGYEEFNNVDLVVEASVERMPVKKNILRETEEVLPEHAVFATNTSSLSVTELAQMAERPRDVVGMHFFNPVHKMPLVEIVRTELSSDASLATAFKFVTKLGKTPVLVADRPGFLVNRLLAPYLNEAGFLLENGASVTAIDQALTAFGKFAIRPLVEVFRKEPDENIRYHIKETLTKLGWNPNRVRLDGVRKP